MTQPLGTTLQQVLPSVRADLERLVRIPSVSADPAAAPHMRDSAAEVAALLKRAGLLRADVVVFADAANWTADVPSLTTTLRGGVSVIVEV